MHLKKTRALARKTKPTYPTIEAATKARMNGQNPVSETAAAPLVLRGLMELETSSELSFDSSLDDDGDEPAGETAVNKL